MKLILINILEKSYFIKNLSLEPKVKEYIVPCIWGDGNII